MARLVHPAEWLSFVCDDLEQALSLKVHERSLQSGARSRKIHRYHHAINHPNLNFQLDSQLPFSPTGHISNSSSSAFTHRVQIFPGPISGPISIIINKLYAAYHVDVGLQMSNWRPTHHKMIKPTPRVLCGPFLPSFSYKSSRSSSWW